MTFTLYELERRTGSIFPRKNLSMLEHRGTLVMVRMSTTGLMVPLLLRDPDLLRDVSSSFRVWNFTLPFLGKFESALTQHVLGGKYLSELICLS